MLIIVTGPVFVTTSQPVVSNPTHVHIFAKELSRPKTAFIAIEILNSYVYSLSIVSLLQQELQSCGVVRNGTYIKLLRKIRDFISISELN